MQQCDDLPGMTRQPMTLSRYTILRDIEDIVVGLSLPLKHSYARHLHFEDLGLDSLAIVELVAEAELRYSLMIEDADYRQIRSADEFATYLLGRLG